MFSLKPPKNPDSNSQMMQLVRASRPCKLQSKLSMMMMPVSLLPPSMLALAKPTIKIFTAQRNLWSPFPRFPVATFPLTGIISSRKSFSIQFPAQESNTHKKKRVFPPGPFIGARGGSLRRRLQPRCNIVALGKLHRCKRARHYPIIKFIYYLSVLPPSPFKSSGTTMIITPSPPPAFRMQHSLNKSTIPTPTLNQSSPLFHFPSNVHILKSTWSCFCLECNFPCLEQVYLFVMARKRVNFTRYLNLMYHLISSLTCSFDFDLKFDLISILTWP